MVSSTESVVCDSHTTFDGSRTSTVSACVGRVHDRDVLGRLAGGALDLFVALVADQQDLEVVAREAHGLAVHLRHERAGRVDRLQTAIGCRVHDGRRHAVRAEDDVRALGHLVDLVDEDRARCLELGDDVDVVHDLLAHVDRRAEALERLLDGDHGAVHAGAIAARSGQQHPLLSGDGDILEAFAPPRNAGNGHVTDGCPRCWCSPSSLRAAPCARAEQPAPPDRAIRSTPNERTAMTTFQPEPVPGAAAAARLGAAPRLDPAGPDLGRPGSTRRSAASSRRGARCGSRARSPSWNLRGGNVFGRLKDLATDATISFRIWSSHPRAAARRPQGRRPRRSRASRPTTSSSPATSASRVSSMRHVGLGDQLEQLERLRAQLRAEGLFDAARKKPLPFLPHVIGLITGEKSDAEKDVHRNAELRWPQVRFRTAYAAVQGDRCVPETIGALKALDADPDVDVIVIARGGGDPQTLLGLQRRATAARGGRGIHSRRQRDRPRERPSAARRRRRPARLDPDRRGQARRAGCRRAARRSSRSCARA